MLGGSTVTSGTKCSAVLVRLSLPNMYFNVESCDLVTHSTPALIGHLHIDKVCFKNIFYILVFMTYLYV